jgi:hypothetical protein
MASFSVQLSFQSFLMAQKENKGGELTNKQVEEDLKVKDKGNAGETGHVGLQDTGDSTVRQFGTDVQRNDGWAAEDQDSTGK